MSTVHHPAFPEVTADVAGDKLDEHLEQGWVLLPDEDFVEVVPPGAFTATLADEPVASVQHIAPFDPTEQVDEPNSDISDGPDGGPEHVAYSFRRRNR